jgi:hypothetical protein
MNESHQHGITPPGGHGHGQDITIPSGPGKPPLHFSETEWSSFRQSDQGAGRSVVLLMGGIFSTGLVLYAIVAYFVWFKVR